MHKAIHLTKATFPTYSTKDHPSVVTWRGESFAEKLSFTITVRTF